MGCKTLPSFRTEIHVNDLSSFTDESPGQTASWLSGMSAWKAHLRKTKMVLGDARSRMLRRSREKVKWWACGGMAWWTSDVLMLSAVPPAGEKKQHKKQTGHKSISPFCQQAKEISSIILCNSHKTESACLFALLFNSLLDLDRQVQETLKDRPWKEKKGLSSVRPTLELFHCSHWGNVWETEYSAYGLSWAWRCHLKPNWTELQSTTICDKLDTA